MNETKFESKGSQLTVTRIFNAPLALVWRAWTEKELLDQWWAPKPWKSETTHMDFNVGGYRYYSMVGPQGERHFCRTDYLSININQSFSGKDSFCDDTGNVNTDFPIAEFQNQFEVSSDKTLVTVVTQYKSEEQLQQVIKMGMQEGLTMAYENLDMLLVEL